MDSLGEKIRKGETEAHLRLKRCALVWAQSHGYTACAAEVTLPRCRYRADVAAYRPNRSGPAVTAIFECKQAREDLRRDNGCGHQIKTRLETLDRRRQVLERNLRVHYPASRLHDSLFAEFDSHDFAAIDHHGYRQVMREIGALQNRLFDCIKFETLLRYQCANLLFLVLPDRLWPAAEIPIGWGALVERNDELVLLRKAVWQEIAPARQLNFLERIAVCATRGANRQLGVTFEEVHVARVRGGV